MFSSKGQHPPLSNVTVHQIQLAAPEKFFSDVFEIGTSLFRILNVVRIVGCSIVTGRLVRIEVVISY